MRISDWSSDVCSSDLTRLFLCHDYKAPGRDRYVWETTVAEERATNIHLHDGIEEDAFVAMRNERDKTLQMPVLILPSVQVNMRGGELPPAENNRSAARRVGKECVSTCSSRWSAYH